MTGQGIYVVAETRVSELDWGPQGPHSLVDVHLHESGRGPPQKPAPAVLGPSAAALQSQAPSQGAATDVSLTQTVGWPPPLRDEP